MRNVSPPGVRRRTDLQASPCGGEDAVGAAVEGAQQGSDAHVGKALGAVEADARQQQGVLRGALAARVRDDRAAEVDQGRRDRARDLAAGEIRK